MLLLDFFDDFGIGISFFLFDNELNAALVRLIPGGSTWRWPESLTLAEETTTVSAKHT
jgi:hypothetical protein